MRKSIVYLALFLTILFTGCAGITGMESVQTMNTSEDNVYVHFIDVGQGDSTFIQSASGNVLIDGGEPSDGDTVLSYLEQYGVTKIDYLVATHPHSDHIGGLINVISQIPVDNIIMPNAVNTTKTFENLIDTIKEKQIKVTKAVPNYEFKIGEQVFTILAPNEQEYEDLNNYSVVVKMTYGKNSALFMGDAEKLSENEILDVGYSIKTNLIKIGHHGSKSSSSSKFIDKVSPEIAVISCGKDNSYGHPHKETLKTLNDRNINTYRTDELSNIVVTFDKDKINVD